MTVIRTHDFGSFGLHSLRQIRLAAAHAICGRSGEALGSRCRATHRPGPSWQVYPEPLVGKENLTVKDLGCLSLRSLAIIARPEVGEE